LINKAIRLSSEVPQRMMLITLIAVRVEVDNQPIRLQLCDTAGQVLQ